MFCNKCGNKVEPNQQYCNKCGNKLTYNNFQEKIDYNKINYSNNSNISSNKSLTIAFVIMVIFTIIFVGIVIYFIFNNNGYYFDDEAVNNEKEQTAENNNTQTKGKYKTDIIRDNVYYGISVNSKEDANNLIIQDSVNQKKSDYSEEIIKIENNIIEKYNITAVNL